LNVALKNYASQSKESEVLKMEDNKETPEVETPEEKFVSETNSIEGEEPEVDKETPAKDEGEEIPANVEENSTGKGEEKTPEETPIDYSAQILELNTQLLNLQNAYNVLEQEVIVLRDFKFATNLEKAKAEKEAEYAKKEAVFTELSIALTDEEMKPVKDKIDELSVKEIADQLNAIFTAKNLAQIKAKKFSNDASKGGVAIEIPKKESPKSRYAV
jgi:hypothetical protein